MSQSVIRSALFIQRCWKPWIIISQIGTNLSSSDFFNNIGASATFKSGTANDRFRVRHLGMFIDRRGRSGDDGGSTALTRAELDRQAEQEIIDTFGPLIEQPSQPGE
jgi:hypothetical protein